MILVPALCCGYYRYIECPNIHESELAYVFCPNPPPVDDGTIGEHFYGPAGLSDRERTLTAEASGAYDE